MDRRKVAINALLIIVMPFLAYFVADNFTTLAKSYKLQRIIELNSLQGKRLKEIIALFEEHEEIASVTSRIALAGPIGNLQEERRNLEKLTVSQCLANPYQIAIEGMNSTIDAYLAFMGNSYSRLNVGAKFQEGKSFLEQAKEEIQNCMDIKHLKEEYIRQG